MNLHRGALNTVRVAAMVFVLALSVPGCYRFTPISIFNASVVVYTANSELDSITKFAMSRYTGELTKMESITLESGSQPISLAVDHKSQMLFVAAYGIQKIFTYSIDPLTAELKYLTETSLSAPPTLITASPKAKGLYSHRKLLVVTEGGDFSFYKINANTGALTLASSFSATTGDPSSFDFAEDGAFGLYSSENRLGICTFDSDSANCTDVNAGFSPASKIHISPNQKLAHIIHQVDTAGFNDHIHTAEIDADAGTVGPSFLINTQSTEPTNALVSSANGQFIYSVDESSQIESYTVDLEDGSLTFKETTPLSCKASSVRRSEEFIVVSCGTNKGNVYSFEVDAVTGGLTQVSKSKVKNAQIKDLIIVDVD